MKILKQNINNQTTIYINKGFNSCYGNFYSISAVYHDPDHYIYNNYYKELIYNGYSLNESIRKYREAVGLKYKRCDIIMLD